MKESQLISDSREKTSVTSVHSTVGYVMCRQNIKKKNMDFSFENKK